MPYFNQGHGMEPEARAWKEKKEKENRTQLIIDDSSIYEIDLDCEECRRKNRKN